MAWRVFLLFVLCALVPVSLLALLSFSQVTKQLERQALRRLHSECKASGLTIMERLFFLEADLEMVISGLDKGKPGAGTFPAGEARKWLSERFRSLVLVSGEGGPHPLLGEETSTFEMKERLRDDERRHIAAGKSLVLVGPREGEFADLFMIHAVDPARLDQGWLVGRIHPDYLWGGEGFAAPETDLFVFDRTGALLFATLPDRLPLEALEQARRENPASGRFTWGAKKEQHLAGYRELFMLHDFFTRWVLVRSQSAADILAPVKDFKKIFPLVVLLSFLVVLLLSHNQIRRVLVPVESLRDAAVRFGARDFRTRVTIESRDEFQLLGSSFNEMAESLEDHFEVMTTINRIGVALSAERDTESLLKIIFQGARDITSADAGALYTVEEGRQLKLVAAEIDSLHFGASELGSRRVFLYDRQGKPNLGEATVFSTLNRMTVNIPDIYEDRGFDFSQYIAFDRKTGYRSKSFLAVPLRNHEDESIGVLILLNAQDRESRAIVEFSQEDQRLVETLASQAAVAMTKNRLLEDFKRLFDALTELVATAIDEKSKYTGDHCRRVPVLAVMLAQALNRAEGGVCNGGKFSDEALYELRVAALLHDCGKVTTPVHIIDKSKRLETIFDRMELVDTRFEVLKRDAQLAWLGKKISTLRGEGGTGLSSMERELEERLLEIDADREFLSGCNQGTEFVTEAMQQRVRHIAKKYRWANSRGEEAPCLSDEEILNLSVSKGTLTPAEREMIEYHVTATVKMLEGLPYPKSLCKVPQIVGTHHERMDGRGYPQGLRGEDIPLQGRILAIADVFEALTAKGRPYKKPTTLMEALRILGTMKEEGHIDPELFHVFLEEEVYMRFAEEFLDPDQMDEVVLEAIPGYEDRARRASAPAADPVKAPRRGKAA